ncbi:MAG: Hsp20/alpha crystallin family protein [Deltaproteobacteria bacterium]|nr:Hsp20/alpha crystallin family protein [Deltaproteobacteria bacterium]
MASGEPTQNGLFFTPLVDIYETDESLTLVADMPGVTKGNLDIDLAEGILTITGTVPVGEDMPQLAYQEYQIGGFTRKFRVGEAIDQSGIRAKLEDGVLRLVLPKAKSLRPKKIEVEVA